MWSREFIHVLVTLSNVAARIYSRVFLTLVLASLLALIFWRPAAAWWCLDFGNLALTRGDVDEALAWFARGLSFQPNSTLLHEDRGRALLERDPAAALAEFKRAGCGAPCLAEQGDAQSRLGRADAAVADYLQAKAVARLGVAVSRLAAQGRFEKALDLERALSARLSDRMLDRADLARAYAMIGWLSAKTAAKRAVLAPSYRRDAIAAYARATQLAPYNEGYLLSYSFAQLDWGDKQAARDAFNRLLRMHPHQADAERALARLHGDSPGDQ